MSVKATKKRLNLNSNGNDDLMLCTQIGENLNLSWVKFPAACCDKSELNPKNMILRGLPRRDFIRNLCIDGFICHDELIYFFSPIYADLQLIDKK